MKYWHILKDMDEPQKPDAEWRNHVSILFMWTAQNKQIPRDRKLINICLDLGMGMGAPANKHEVSFGDDGNGSELDWWVGCIIMWIYKPHLIIYLKRTNFMLHK